jgi:hypothetical protein
MSPITGARGTDALASEQRPNPFHHKKRKRKRKGRAQPFRRGSENRQAGPSLSAMVKGAPAFLPNPQDAKRAAQKRHRRGR